MGKAYHSALIPTNSLVTSSAQSFLLSTSKPHRVQNKKYPPLVVSCSGLKKEAQKSKKIVRNAAEKARQRTLIKIPTSDRKWGDEWTASYVVTLRELGLADLAYEDGEQDKPVSIGLSIQKHASFGLSIQGIITTSFNAQCTSCFSLYHREIDANFSVLVLPCRKSRKEVGIPEIGGNDSSVIYVKPGCEAILDSLVKDSIRLTASAKDTCTELCASSSRTWQCRSSDSDGEVAYDERWSRLLEIRDSFGST